MLFDNITILSGGQTGVDRSALDFCIKYNVKYEGSCPLGRIAEDGIIDSKYKLRETNSSEYSVRTKLNISNSDGTLIIVENELDYGTELTIELCKQLNKPYIILLLGNYDLKNIIDFIKDNHIIKLNIAGPRESNSPGIYKKSSCFYEAIKDSSF